MSRQLTELFSMAREVFWRKLTRLVLGPVVGRIPYTTVRSLVELLYNEQVENHVIDIRMLYEPLIAKYNFPESYPACFRRDKTFERRCIYLLKDVCVSPRSGLVWLGEGYILEESVGSLRRIIQGWDGVLHEPLRATKALNLEKPVVSCPPTGYFHWLFERMPLLLHALKFAPDAQILAPEGSPNYLLSALEVLLGLEDYKKRVIFSQSPVRILQFIMPEAEVYSGFVHPGDIIELRSTFKSRINLSKTRGDELIYISRKYAPARRLTNEQDIEEKLLEQGFRIVYCEHLHFRDQIELFSKARLIVALHGAGLGNMVWADPPCQVLEIFPYTWINDCYARLAQTLGFGYDYIVCGAEGSMSKGLPLELLNHKVIRLLQKC